MNAIYLNLYKRLIDLYRNHDPLHIVTYTPDEKQIIFESRQNVTDVIMWDDHIIVTFANGNGTLRIYETDNIAYGSHECIQDIERETSFIIDYGNILIKLNTITGSELAIMINDLEIS